MQLRLRKSNAAFVLTCAVLVGIKLLFQFYPGDFPGKDQALAFTWPIVCGVSLLGLAGLYAEHSLQIPDAFDNPERARRAIIWATVAGVIYGCITIATDLYHPGEKSPVATADWPHMALPWSIPFYTFGAILLEFLLRLGGLCALVWVLHVVLLRRKFLPQAFWSINLIVALYEVLPFMLRNARRGRWDQVVLDFAGPLYLSNIFEGWLLLRFGWFTPILFRLAFYLIWHIVYGGLFRPS